MKHMLLMALAMALSACEAKAERYLFEQNFAKNNVSLVYIDRKADPITPYDSYVPNIGFSAGKRVIYSGSVKLLDEPIPESALAVLNKNELRLLRNSIYAKHGRIFQSDDLKTYFQQFDWYKPNSNDVDNKLTNVDKKNVERIQAFENAKPNPNLNKSSFASLYYDQLPLGVGSGCPEIYFKDGNAIEWYGWREDNFKGSYKIENGFLIVLVTEQPVEGAGYFLNNNWHWPSGATYKDGMVVYKEPVKMVFPVGNAVSHVLHKKYSGRQIGSSVWWEVK